MNSFSEALKLIFTFNPEVYQIIMLTLAVTVLSTAFSSVIGVPLGVIIGSSEFRGKRILVRLTYTFTGMPPVVVGLIVYLLLSRKGLFGQAELLFTPAAMVIAQIFIITPLITGLTISNVKTRWDLMRETCFGLNLKKIRSLFILLYESRYAIVSVIMVGYGRAISEVGAVMLVGGNIQYSTRVMTTDIVLETGKGNYAHALALGIILLVLSFMVNWLLQCFQGSLDNVNYNS